MVLDVDVNRSPSKVIAELTQLRRQALKKSNRALGYPLITVLDKLDSYKEVIKAGGLYCQVCRDNPLKRI